MKKLIFWSFISLLFVGCVNSPQIIYDKNGYSKQGYNIQGYDKFGFNMKGFDKSGFNKLGFNENGFDRNGFNTNGYNSNGYNKLGFNSQGFDKSGFNKLGFNENGFDRNGFNTNGYNLDGYNKKGLNSKGLTKKQVLKKEFDKLIKSKSTIKKVFHSILKKQEKDKYESSSEYNERRKKKKVDTSIILESDIRTEYNPDSGEYKLKVWISTPIMSWAYKYNRGVLSDNMITSPSRNIKIGNNTFRFKSDSSSHKTIESNAYGHTVEVDNSSKTNYIIYPENFEKMINENNILTKEKYYLVLTLNVSKGTSRKYDKEKFKIKIEANLIDIQNSMYKGTYYKEATIDSTYSDTYYQYLSKAHINKLVIYNENTNEILFHYIN